MARSIPVVLDLAGSAENAGTPTGTDEAKTVGALTAKGEAAGEALAKGEAGVAAAKGEAGGAGEAASKGKAGADWGADAANIEVAGDGEAAPKGETGAGLEAAAANREVAGAAVAAANGEAWVGAKLACANGESEVGSGTSGGETGVAACPNVEATPAVVMEGMAAANGLIGKADDGGADGDLDGSAAAKGEAWTATGNAVAEERVPAINADNFATGRATVRGS